MNGRETDPRGSTARIVTALGSAGRKAENDGRGLVIAIAVFRGPSVPLARAHPGDVLKVPLPHPSSPTADNAGRCEGSQAEATIGRGDPGRIGLRIESKGETFHVNGRPRGDEAQAAGTVREGPVQPGFFSSHKG